MIVQHSIQIIAKVDGAQIHSDTFNIRADGTVADAMANFDARQAVVRALRMEADMIEREVMEDAWRRERNGNWIDAASGIEEGL